MKYSHFVKNGFVGASVGLIVVVIGILIKMRRYVANGIYLQTFNIQRDTYIHTLVRSIRPLCQTGRFTVNKEYATFVRALDELIGRVASGDGPGDADHDTLMQLLRVSIIKKPLGVEIENQFSNAIRQLINH